MICMCICACVKVLHFLLSGHGSAAAQVNVVQYFKHKHGIDCQYPELPCLQLGNARTCIPMEFVTVLGGCSVAYRL